MAEVLSQHEIDQLLTAISSQDDERDEIYNSRSKKIKIYDFKRPDKFSKQQIRSISSIHDKFCRNLTKSLSTKYNKKIKIDVASVDQLTYEEYIRSIPNPTLLFTSNFENLGPIAMEIDLIACSAILNKKFESVSEIEIEEFMKSHERVSKEEAFDVLWHRKNTKTEGFEEDFSTKKKTKKFISSMEKDLEKTWTSFLNSGLLNHIESFDNPQFCTMCNPGDMTILVTCEVKTLIDNNEIVGMINICYPAETFRSIMGDLDNLNYKKKFPIIGFKKEEMLEEIKMSDKPENSYDRYKDVKVDVDVRLGKGRKSLREIFEMGEGTILVLDKLAGEPVDVYVSGVLKAKGEVLIVDEKFGVRVTELV